MSQLKQLFDALATAPVKPDLHVMVTDTCSAFRPVVPEPGRCLDAQTVAFVLACDGRFQAVLLNEEDQRAFNHILDRAMDAYRVKAAQTKVQQTIYNHIFGL